MLPISKKYIFYFSQKSKGHEESKTKSEENINIIQPTVFEAMQIKRMNSFFFFPPLAYKFKSILPSIRIGVEKAGILYPIAEIQIDKVF